LYGRLCHQLTNYDPAATVDDGSCTLPSADDGCEFTDDSYDPITCEILNVSNCPQGTVFQVDVCACMPVDVVGCTDTDACNFDPMATMDNASCIYPGASCDDGNSFTDNDIVQADCSCEGIPNGEEVPTVGEWGLIILALLLLTLAVLGIRQKEIHTEKV